MDEPMKFEVGQYVEKFTGDYQMKGEVRAVFTTTRNRVRYVVEHEPGFLHIYSGTNLRPAQRTYRSSEFSGMASGQAGEAD